MVLYKNQNLSEYIVCQKPVELYACLAEGQAVTRCGVTNRFLLLLPSFCLAH